MSKLVTTGSSYVHIRAINYHGEPETRNKMAESIREHIMQIPELVKKLTMPEIPTRRLSSLINQRLPSIFWKA
jgi:hypothetical protein